MHRLNNIDPNIELFGTPNSDIRRLEKWTSMLQNALEKLNNFLSNIESL